MKRQEQENQQRANGKIIKVSSPEEVCKVMQSYVLTTAKYDFSVYEKRILYYCVRLAQQYLQGERLKGLTVDKIARKPAKEITMPIREILLNESDKNHEQVKKAALSLLDKKIIYEDKKIWNSFSIIQNPIITKQSDTLTFGVSPLLWQCILDFSSGYHPYELQVAMKLRSVYSMRFYELVSEPKKDYNPVIPLETIKSWFCITDKYSDNNMFINRVIKTAQKDLDKHAPWSFDFTPKKEGRKITAIEIKPRFCPQNANEALQKKLDERRTDFSWTVPDRETRAYLTDTIGFSTAELKNTRSIWADAYNIFGPELRSILQDKMIVARQLQREGRLTKDIKSYIVGAIKKIVEDIKKANPINDVAKSVADKLS